MKTLVAVWREPEYANFDTLPWMEARAKAAGDKKALLAVEMIYTLRSDGRIVDWRVGDEFGPYTVLDESVSVTGVVFEPVGL